MDPRRAIENEGDTTPGFGRARAFRRVVLRTSKSPLLLRLLPCMTDMAFVMPLVFLFVGMQGAKTLLGDGDTGWHLRTGEWILSHGRVPSHDIFSFTRSGQPWYAWEWLWDVIFGWLHLHFGMSAVLVGSSLVLAMTFALLFRLARNRSGEALVALAATLVAAAGSTGHGWLDPPVHHAVYGSVLYMLDKVDRQGASRRLLWVLPPLMVLWTNLHGGSSWASF